MFLAVGAVAMLAVAAALGWLCGTTAGARWLLASVSLHTPLKITAQSVEGRLLDHLRLTGVRAAMPLREAELDILDVRWHPQLLLGGRVAIRELTLNGVRISDNTPSVRRPPDLSWPGMPGMAQLFDATISRLRVDDFSYRRAGRQPVTLGSVAASVDWLDGLLSLSDLVIVSPDGRVTGTAQAGFRRPSLSADLIVGLPHPLAGMDRFSIHARLLSGRGDEQVAGDFDLSGARGAHRQLEFTGEVGMTRHGFNLRRLHLDRQGRRGRITGAGTLSLADQEPLLKLRVALAGLDMAPEVGTSTDLTGEVVFEGWMTDYRGRFELANRGGGWRTAHLSGDFRGNGRGMRLSSLSGTLLGGSVGGDLEVVWEGDRAVRGAMTARGLNPAVIAPGWRGVINADLRGAMSFPVHVPLRWSLDATLLESTLHGQPLTGGLQMASSDGGLRIDTLALHGKGFDIDARGTLDTGLAFTTRISDLSLLIPTTAGAFRAAGRVRWRNGGPIGYVNGYGRALRIKGVGIATADVTARLGEGKGYPILATAALHSVSYERFQAGSLSITVEGTLHDHTLEAAVQSSGAEVRAGLIGSYDQEGWKGKIARLSGRDAVGPWRLVAPAALTVTAGRLAAAPMIISGVGAERITVSVNLSKAPLSGNVLAQWSQLNLTRANQWLQGIRVDGATTGSLRLGFAPEGRLVVAANADFQGAFLRDGHVLKVSRGQLMIDGSERGTRAGLELGLADGGLLKGSFSSSAPARPAPPDVGNVSLEWSAIDLDILQPWLPRGLSLEGRLAGHAAGKVRMDRHLELTGSAVFSQTTIHLRAKGGEYSSTVRNAAIRWTWQGETLAGAASLELAEYGQIGGRFELPLPARMPLAIRHQGSVRAAFKGRFRELGLLTALFPGMIRESHGELDGNLNVAGTLQEPRVGGDLHLVRAGAYFPAAGIHVKDVQLDASLGKDVIRIDNFQADSGPGRITGKAVIRLTGWHVAGYSGSLNGERFQAIYLPELRMLIEPHLTFGGTSDKLSVRGDIRVPELLVQKQPLSAVVAPSKDVIIEGVPRSAAYRFPLALDIQVRVIPGNQVQVKLEGIDAQLGGSIDLNMTSPDRITSEGEISVVKGRYKVYGINLEIVRGRVYYAGGSIDRPTLDILALRTVGDVRAGVTITGSAQAPLVKLYSEPAMADTDILAYIVLGHPLGTGSDQATLVAQAAGQLLSSSQAFSLKDQIKNRLGLSTLDIGSKDTSSAIMGYKVISVAPPSATTAQSTSSLPQTMATAGKYLTPQLYLSYGRSLFTGENLIRLRYDISRRWKIETETGTESGADIYYKIDFK